MRLLGSTYDFRPSGTGGVLATKQHFVSRVRHEIEPNPAIVYYSTNSDSQAIHDYTWDHPQNGDLLIGLAASENTANIASVTSPMTELDSTGSTPETRVYYDVLDGTETARKSFGPDTDRYEYAGLTVYFRNLTYTSFAFSNNSTADNPSLASFASGDVFLIVATIDQQFDPTTAPSGYTKILESNNPQSGPKQMLTAAYFKVSAGGTEDPGTIGVNNTGGDSNIWTIRLTP